jgi:trehalose 6-phosphate phosphatase
MVVELRAPGPNKGEAVEAFMREPPFAGATPIFLGDDLTDEDGFRAARKLGGFGVIVGPRRPTQALFALADVADAQAWLLRLAGAKG